MNTEEFPAKEFRLKEFLFAPFGCLISIPPFIFFGGILIVAIVSFLVYENVNTEIFGIGRPPYDQLQIDNRWEHPTLGDHSWTVEYESNNPVRYIGLVRHISPIRMTGIPFLTHDVLITSGEFSDPKLVRVSVVDHTFSWSSNQKQNPQGTINLIHAVPQDETIYLTLLHLQKEVSVRITGYEILRINALDSRGERYLWWQDAGCNTLLITGIETIPTSP